MLFIGVEGFNSCTSTFMYQTFQCSDFTVSQTVGRVVGGDVDGAGTGSLDDGALCSKPAVTEWNSTLSI